MEKMITFHGKPELKQKYLARLKMHAEADELIQGQGWENGKGCAVGCTLENYDHAEGERELGIPEWLWHVEDKIFEGLKNEDAKIFAIEFLESIPVGVNLELIKYKFTSYLCQENIDIVEKLNISDPLKKQVIEAIEMSKSVNDNTFESGEWDESAARSAESAAWSASRSAAWSAESAAWSASRSAAWSAESAARSAESAAWSAARSAESAARSAARSAESAARSAAWSASRSAESAAYKKHAEVLLKMLKGAI